MRYIWFADPYKQCLDCGEWVNGVGVAVPLLLPCGHRADYRDVCPSWSPVDGCGCAAFTGRHPDSPLRHPMRRPPDTDDGKIYGPAR